MQKKLTCKYQREDEEAEKEKKTLSQANEGKREEDEKQLKLGNLIFTKRSNIDEMRLKKIVINYVYLQNLADDCMSRYNFNQTIF